ncbi:hypothetical protein C8Q80DRAFT_1338337 [Daedaleopsis nitida]|nr:hypothetical protein C8Q80DRAFT_1338337 [Daedaleopsis nitida]
MADTARPVTIVALHLPRSSLRLPQPRPAPFHDNPPRSDTSSGRSRLRRPDSVMSVCGQWPVPQVIIYYRDMKIAWGREAIAALGKTPGVAFTNAHYEGSLFARNALLFGVFYHTFGKDDSGPVMLGSLGWAELIQNVARIELIYDEA